MIHAGAIHVHTKRRSLVKWFAVMEVRNRCVCQAAISSMFYSLEIRVE